MFAVQVVSFKNGLIHIRASKYQGLNQNHATAKILTQGLACRVWRPYWPCGVSRSTFTVGDIHDRWIASVPAKQVQLLSDHSCLLSKPIKSSTQAILNNHCCGVPCRCLMLLPSGPSLCWCRICVNNKVSAVVSSSKVTIHPHCKLLNHRCSSSVLWERPQAETKLCLCPRICLCDTVAYAYVCLKTNTF